MRFVTWKGIRNVGELHILTRASYLMLGIVPMLAALWPGVRVVVNRYNDVVTDSTAALERTSQSLQRDAVRLREELAGAFEKAPGAGLSSPRLDTALTAINQASLELERRTAAFVKDHPPRTLEDPRLPPTWAIAFFAALAVLVGHVIYQIAAPPILKQNSMSQFVSSRLDEYAKYRSAAALERAEFFRLTGHWPEPEAPTQGPLDIVEKQTLRREMTVIEQGAMSEYLHIADRNPAAILGAALSYFAGVLLIAWIVIRQSHAVAAAAGWLG